MIYEDFMGRALTDASGIAQSYFGKVSGTTKVTDNNQVLTEADLAIGKHIISLIEKAYPEHNIIDEEAGAFDKGSAYTWVIDPIDGTSNFAQGVPLFGTYLGLLHNDQPYAGGIVLPYFNKLYVAEKGQGAYCNGERIHVTKEISLLNILAVYQTDADHANPNRTRQEISLSAEITLATRNIRTSGSCFDLAMVAEGKYGAVMNRYSKIWDNVAPHIIIEEAGGIYTEFFGEPLDYSGALQDLGRNYASCAASRELHSKLQTIIHA